MIKKISSICVACWLLCLPVYSFTQVDTVMQIGEPDKDFGTIDHEGDDSLESEREFGPNEIFQLDKAPQPINLDEVRRSIGYPMEARDNGIQGKVIVQILISQSGEYLKHVVLKEGHPLLFKAVEQKIARLKFTPGIYKGRPTKIWIAIPFEFKLI